MFTFIIIIVGLGALVLSGFGWYRNVELFRLKLANNDFSSSDYLDFFIRFVWQLYVTVFSFGFIINNLF